MQGARTTRTSGMLSASSSSISRSAPASMHERLSQTRTVTGGGRGSPSADHVEVGVERRHLVDLGHGQAHQLGEPVQVAGRQAALGVLDLVQVLDQQRRARRVRGRSGRARPRPPPGAARDLWETAAPCADRRPDGSADHAAVTAPCRLPGVSLIADASSTHGTSIEHRPSNWLGDARWPHSLAYHIPSAAAASRAVPVAVGVEVHPSPIAGRHSATAAKKCWPVGSPIVACFAACAEYTSGRACGRAQRWAGAGRLVSAPSRPLQFKRATKGEVKC